MHKYLLILIGLIIINIDSFADQRSFVWTYEYMIMEPGKAEIEQYTTFSTPNFDEMKGTVSTELNFEAEIGMSEHYDIAVYQNFKQVPGGNLQYSGFKLRTRYLIGEKNKYFIDPLIYLEYKGVADFSKHGLEAKLILEKDFGDLRIAFNPYFEYEFSDEAPEFTPKYALGIKYAFSKLFSLGIESKGDKNGYYFGPTLSHGSEKFWSALGALYKIGDVETGKPEFQLRMILGLHF